MDGGSTVMPIVYPEISLTEICDILETAENVLILTHVNPDGDTIGSAYALHCPSPIPHRLAFLMHGDGDPAWSADETDSAADTYDVICSVDVASPMQLGELGCLLSVVDFMIDHHGTGEPFAPHWIDEHASACGEMLYDIYCELSSRGHFEVHPEAARRIYAAIVSDTGSFKFSNTTTKTHLIAAGMAVWTRRRSVGPCLGSGPSGKCRRRRWRSRICCCSAAAGSVWCCSRRRCLPLPG